MFTVFNPLERSETVVAKRQTNKEEPENRRPPATTPEGRERQLISLATDLVERKLIDGTATSQEVTHYLKLGSSREKLEQERLHHENELLQAKSEQIASQARSEELFLKAMAAFSDYKGLSRDSEDQDYDD